MWTRTLLATSVATALVFGASVNAATQKDDDSDSVNSWGPWNGVQTAAGPGAGAAAVVPLLLQFAEDQNNLNSGSFDADVDQAGEYREYVSWYSRNQHDRRKSTVRAGFSERPTVAAIDGGEGYSLGFAVNTEAGDQVYQPRTANGKGEDGRFHSFQGVGNRTRNRQIVNLDVVLNPGAEQSAAYFEGNYQSRNQIQQRKGWHNKHVLERGSFIFGTSSTLASVNNLLAGNVEAVYLAKNAFSRGGSAIITMQLGAGASWSGQFNPKNSSSFSVNQGSFNGVDLVGSVVTTAGKKGIAGGSVNGSFFGDSAQHIGGIAEVQFNNPKKVNFVDTFTVEQTCLNGCIRER